MWHHGSPCRTRLAKLLAAGMPMHSESVRVFRQSHRQWEREIAQKANVAANKSALSIGPENIMIFLRFSSGRVIGALRPRAARRGHGTGGAPIRFHTMAGPSPRHRRPAARDQPRPDRDLAGRPVRAGAVGRRRMPDWAVIGEGPSSARFSRLPRARDLTGRPRGIPGAVGMAWPSGSPGGQCAPAGSR